MESLILSAHGISNVEEKIDNLRGIFSIESLGNDEYSVEYVKDKVSAEEIRRSVMPEEPHKGCSHDQGHDSHDHSHVKSDLKKSYLTETTFNITGVCCGSEVPLVKDALSFPSVIYSSILVNIKAKTVTVQHDTKKVTKEELRDALIEEDFGASIKSSDTVEVKEGGSIILQNDLHIYDLTGSHRVYTTFPPNQNLENVCFSSHSLPADLLTTCFNEKFEHGEAEETCVCGEEEAHLHAHFKGNDCEGGEMGLTQVKLILKTVQNKPMFEICDTMPKSCTAKAKISAVRTSIKVQHGDHEDYLAIVPPIKKVCEGLRGVSKVTVNVTSKLVYVYHDYEGLPVGEVVEALNYAGFGATLKKDARPKILPKVSPTKTSGKSSFSIANMCCASEVPPILSILEPMNGVNNVNVNVTARIVYVDHDFTVVTAEKMMEELNKDGFGAAVKKDAGKARAPIAANHSSSSQLQPIQPPIIEEPKSGFEAFGLPKANVIICGVLWIVSMFAPVFPKPYDQLEQLASLAFFVGIYPIAAKTWDSVKRFSIDANLLMFIAAVGAMGLQQFSEAAGLTFLFSLGEWLESQATGKAKRALESIVSLMPDTANTQTVGEGGKVEFVEVPAEYVGVGDIVLVKTGDKIPVDGDVVKGESVVDESSLTGESRPVKKKVGGGVFSGTINIGMAPLTVVCTATVENSTVSKLIELVEEAQANRSPTEKLVDEFAKRYTPVVVVTSFLMCTVPFFMAGKEVGMEWLYRGIVLIVIACPCALIISTPVAYVAGLAATAQKGIIIKGGVHLEALSRVKIVASDKTGTLTHGEFSVLNVEMIGNWKKPKQVYKYLAIMEKESSHPMAAALVGKAKEEGVELTEKDEAMEHEILKGEGVMGVVDGVKMYVGNERLMCRLDFLKSLPPNLHRKTKNWSTSGGTIGFLAASNKGIICAFNVSDKIRQESSLSIKKLKEMNVDVFMLTGDSEGAAKAVGRKVGLSEDRIMAGLLPVDKLNLIKQFKRNLSGAEYDVENGVEEPSDKTDGLVFMSSKNVLMIGDGVNDAPALACSDVGVAMAEGGAAIAMETADVAIMDSDISKLVYSIQMGRSVVRVIKQNLIFSLVLKVVVIGLVMGGYGNLWLAIISDVGAMLCVTLNGMRLLPRKEGVEVKSKGKRKDRGTGEGEEAPLLGRGGVETYL
ncbi:hypothetical protein TrLO_g1265 [Triparma laevis f. longispina]|uniref:HMA domain-containing protein n=1 Tax=Triparma laevis f. longispina TaxID=1714387 RepID=A0A9W7EAK3_9STRA|nr:hypothetical protein TrLO_g1265 [Triparma laevis f. longispina]